MTARRRSSERRNAATRAVFVNIADMAMIGTTGAAPTSGTRTSGQGAGAIARDPTGDRRHRRQCDDEHELRDRNILKKQNGFSR